MVRALAQAEELSRRLHALYAGREWSGTWFARLRRGTFCRRLRVLYAAVGVVGSLATVCYESLGTHHSI